MLIAVMPTYLRMTISFICISRQEKYLAKGRALIRAFLAAAEDTPQTWQGTKVLGIVPSLSV